MHSCFPVSTDHPLDDQLRREIELIQIIHKRDPRVQLLSGLTSVLNDAPRVC